MSEKPERLYLDLDRTLLDTEKLKVALFAAAEKHFGIPAQKFHTETKPFYLQVGSLTLYDFFVQIGSYGVDEQQAEKVLAKALEGGDYLYPDAHIMLSELKHASIPTRILSFGAERYQNFKYVLAPALRNIPLTVTLYKDIYLGGQMPAPSLLVDDKITSPLPDWCTQFLLDRNAPEPFAQESPQLWRVNSLKNVAAAITVGYNEASKKGNAE